MKKETFSLARPDEPMRQLVRETDKVILAHWAIECAERVLPYFEEKYPEDRRPRHAIDTLHEWIKTGVFSMKVIRKASLEAHAAAKDVEKDSPACSAAHAAGQAVATAHVFTHAYGPAIYGQQAIFRATGSMEMVQQEREWQYNRLLQMNKTQKSR